MFQIAGLLPSLLLSTPILTTASQAGGTSTQVQSDSETSQSGGGSQGGSTNTEQSESSASGQSGSTTSGSSQATEKSPEKNTQDGTGETTTTTQEDKNKEIEKKIKDFIDPIIKESMDEVKKGLYLAVDEIDKEYDQISPRIMANVQWYKNIGFNSGLNADEIKKEVDDRVKKVKEDIRKQVDDFMKDLEPEIRKEGMALGRKAYDLKEDIKNPGLWSVITVPTRAATIALDFNNKIGNMGDQKLMQLNEKIIKTQVDFQRELSNHVVKKATGQSMDQVFKDFSQNSGAINTLMNMLQQSSLTSNFDPNKSTSKDNPTNPAYYAIPAGITVGIPSISVLGYRILKRFGIMGQQTTSFF